MKKKPKDEVVPLIVKVERALEEAIDKVYNDSPEAAMMSELGWMNTIVDALDSIQEVKLMRVRELEAEADTEDEEFEIDEDDDDLELEDKDDDEE